MQHLPVPPDTIFWFQPFLPSGVYPFTGLDLTGLGLDYWTDLVMCDHKVEGDVRALSHAKHGNLNHHHIVCYAHIGCVQGGSRQ